MSTDHKIVEITPDNLDKFDLLCSKSKKESVGYQNKLSWFRDRYAEGLRVQLLLVNERGKMTSRGFIEYMPGERSWRAVNANGYNVIHCLWVVGKWKDQGLGRKLIQSCIHDSRLAGRRGVAVVTSERTWLVGRKIFLENGFQLLDTAPPSFSLLVFEFDGNPDASFPSNWEERARVYGEGLTVVYADQCPYIPAAVRALSKFAEHRGIEFKAIKLENSEEVRAKAPSPYGVFSLVYEGRLISYTYEKDSKLEELIGSEERMSAAISPSKNIR